MTNDLDIRAAAGLPPRAGERPEFQPPPQAGALAPTDVRLAALESVVASLVARLAEHQRAQLDAELTVNRRLTQVELRTGLVGGTDA